MGWAKPSLLFESSGSSLLLAVDHNGKLHSAWYEQGSLFYSKLEGTVWSPPVSIYTIPTGMRVSELTLAFDSHGRVHVAWVEVKEPTSWSSVVETSVHHSVGEAGIWSSAVEISTEGCGFPAIAVDSLDRVHLVWQEGYYTQWDGTKWSTPSKIIEGTMPVIPAIAVDSKDNIHVLWSIGTGDPQKKETKEDLFHMIGTIK